MSFTMLRTFVVRIVLLASLPALGLAQDGAPPTAGPVVVTDGPAISSPLVLHTNLPGHSTASVPGLPGVEFKPHPFSHLIFDRPYGNRAGSVAFTATLNLASTADEAVFRDGVLIAQEGSPTGFDPSKDYSAFDTRLGLSGTGEVAFSTHVIGYPTSADAVLVRSDGLAASIIAREGQPIPFLSAGVNYGHILDSVLLLGDGTAAYITHGVTPFGSTMDELLILGNSVQLQVGASIPPGQLGGGTETLRVLADGDFWASEDGAQWLVQGQLNGSTALDEVVLVNGGVVLQEGFVIPGSDFTSPIMPSPFNNTSIARVHMDLDGHWMARGYNADDQDWVVHDGRVVARTGAPITAGSTELWSDAAYFPCFFLQIGGANGHYIIGGVTDGPAASNGVLVLDGTHVIARENDPIDLDGNGFFDDDAYFRAFGDDDAFLSDAGVLTFMANMSDGSGSPIGQGVFQIALTLGELEPCSAGSAGTGLLSINGHTGGGSRRVVIPQNFPFSVEIGSPAGGAATDFVLFAYLGVPTAAEVFSVPGLDDLCFAPCLVPSVTAQPVLTLASSLPLGAWCTPIANATQTPWSFPVPTGVSVPLTATFQAVQFGTPPTVLVSNAVVLDVP